MNSPSNRLLALVTAGLLGLIGWTAPLSAISVTPPTFTDLVDRAEHIVDATVADIHSEWVVNAKGYRVIKTFVRLRVTETAKGSDDPEINLSFFGGTLDGQTMAIAGMPKFRKGQRGWFFIKDNGQVICPLIYAHHGAYLISSINSATPSQITRLNGTPLRSLSDIGDASHAATTQASTPSRSPLTSADFRSAIVNEYDRLRANQASQP